MTAPRTRKQVKTYAKHLSRRNQSASSCEFCEITADSKQFVSESKYFKVIRNIFPYSIWDDLPVRDHLMLIPKLHTDKLADLPANAAHEFFSEISRYETDGYSIWARSPNSKTKSQQHQHTHLIKLGNKPIKAMLYIRKPYWRKVVK